MNRPVGFISVEEERVPTPWGYSVLRIPKLNLYPNCKVTTGDAIYLNPVEIRSVQVEQLAKLQAEVEWLRKNMQVLSDSPVATPWVQQFVKEVLDKTDF